MESISAALEILDLLEKFRGVLRTKIIPGFINHLYQDRISTLNFPSLAYRRHGMDMIMLYKIIHGLDGSPFDTFFCIPQSTHKIQWLQII